MEWESENVGEEGIEIRATVGRAREEECRFKKGAGVDSIFQPVTSFRVPWGRYDLVLMLGKEVRMQDVHVAGAMQYSN
jgi:hypothetical protein